MVGELAGEVVDQGEACWALELVLVHYPRLQGIAS
jgi:hypothetical protein